MSTAARTAYGRSFTPTARDWTRISLRPWTDGARTPSSPSVGADGKAVVPLVEAVLHASAVLLAPVVHRLLERCPCRELRSFRGLDSHSLARLRVTSHPCGAVCTENLPKPVIETSSPP